MSKRQSRWRTRVSVGGGVVVALVSSRAGAQELLPPVSDVNGIRALGLGIPSVALAGVNSGESVLSNPAWVGFEGKSRQKGVLRGFWFPSATIGANGTTRALAKAYFSGQGSTQQRLENFLKAAQNEQTPFASFALQPGMTLGFVHLGAFARTRVEGYVWQPTHLNQLSTEAQAIFSGDAGSVSGRIPLSFDASMASQMNVRATIERGTSVSVAVPYKNTGVYLGVTARPTWRTEYMGTVGLSEPLVSESASALRAKFNESRATPVDVGMAIRLPQLRMRPNVGLKLEDVADTHYKAANGAHQSVIQKSNLMGGVSGWLFQTSKFATQCSLAGHHLNDSRLQWRGKWGAGCEVHLLGNVEADLVNAAPLIFRLGGNQDGLAYGMSWDMPFALVEIASSSARIEGPVGFESRTERRYFLRLTVDANQP